MYIYTDDLKCNFLVNFKFEMILQKDKSQQITSYKHSRAKTNPSLRVLELVSKWKCYILGISLAFFS